MPRKSMAGSTDPPGMAIAVYCGCKTTTSFLRTPKIVYIIKGLNNMLSA